MTNSKQIIEDILNNKLIDLPSIINIYLYGSQVYGTASPQSDIDLILVSNKKEYQLSCGNYNYSIYNKKQFEDLIYNHEISILECIFLPLHLIIQNKISYSNIQINKSKLRHSISAKASNSFVKAKKKFIVEADKNIYVGKKSLFHSLRIPIFGTQIAKYNKIIDYSEANHYWEDIKNCDVDDWDYYYQIYKPVYNKIMSQFRKVAPKLGEI